MIRFCGERLLSGLEVLRKRAERAAASADKGPVRNVPESERRIVSGLIDQLMPEFSRIGLDSSVAQGDLARVSLGPQIEFGALHFMLNNLRNTIIDELGKQLFTWIPPEQHEYLDQDALFGAQVKANFPSAIEDIQAAGNCLAVDLHTACVFHLIRVVERGLCILASKFSVPFDHNNWHNIIEQLESEIRGMDAATFGSDWRDKKKFYTRAANQFMLFKDAWRNHVMHVRDVFDEGKTLSVYSSVRVFMQALAEGGLSE